MNTLSKDCLENHIKTDQLSEAFTAAIMAIFVVSIYFWTSIAVIISVIVGIVWLLTRQFNKIPFIIKQSQVNTWALIVFLFMILGLSYSTAPIAEATAILRKFREFAYIPILSCFFTSIRCRTWAWVAFVSASLITLLISYLMEFNLLDSSRYHTFTFKSRITHGIFIAFFLFYCLHKCVDSPKNRLWYSLPLIIGIHNLYFVTNGRTGQFIFVFLASLFAIQRLSKKGLVISFAVLVFLIMLYFQYSDKSERLHKGLESAKNHIDPSYGPTRNDGDLRLVFWDNTLKLIADKPLLGHGTGSLKQEYQRITGDKNIIVENPHNEFLLFTFQGGFVGLTFYLGFLFSQYRDAKKLALPEKHLAQGLLVTLIITSLFNSPFLDHAEGHWFATMIALCFSHYKILDNEKSHAIAARADLHD